MARQEIVCIATPAQLRNQQLTKTLTAERDFWMKTAEELHDLLESIFYQAAEYGDVNIYQNGKTIKLVATPPTAEASEPA